MIDKIKMFPLPNSNVNFGVAVNNSEIVEYDECSNKNIHTCENSNNYITNFHKRVRLTSFQYKHPNINYVQDIDAPLGLYLCINSVEQLCYELNNFMLNNNFEIPELFLKNYVTENNLQYNRLSNYGVH